MSDETYYTVLNIAEAASASEIKTAYRDIIKQVHPDTITNLAPYLRSIAEEKAKEITEAYTVLSSPSKRSEYDRQLAEYRWQSIPQTSGTGGPFPAQPAPASTSSGPYCNRCGTSLYVSGFCPTCNKFTAPAATPPQPKAVRWLGYNWSPLIRWAREHPMLTISIPIVLLWVIAALSGNDTPSQQAANCPPSQRVEVNGKFVCQAPVQAASASNLGAPSGAFAVLSEEPAPPKPDANVSGVYTGTVHNQTVNLSSSFVVVFNQRKAGVLEGCMEVKPPLYGSGPLHGSIRGSHIDFVVADIRLQGDALKNAVTGSYVVSRQDGQQLGDFRLTKQSGSAASYSCSDGKLIEFEVVDPPATNPQYRTADSPHPKSTAAYAIVGSGYYSTMYKRCAFLPLDNYGRCNYGPETVAELKGGDRVRVLSPLIRAENGNDIYKIRTQQGWEGWIDARGITLESQ